MKGNASAWNSGIDNPTLDQEIKQSLQNLDKTITDTQTPVSKKQEQQSTQNETTAEKLHKEINNVRKKVSSTVSYNPGPEMELGDEDIEYLDPKDEAKRKTRLLQNKEAKLRDQIAEAKKKIEVVHKFANVKTFDEAEKQIKDMEQIYLSTYMMTRKVFILKVQTSISNHTVEYK
jgi:hypothetical protein